jgi:hypothetical protein
MAATSTRSSRRVWQPATVLPSWSPVAFMTGHSPSQCVAEIAADLRSETHQRARARRLSNVRHHRSLLACCEGHYEAYICDAKLSRLMQDRR